MLEIFWRAGMPYNLENSILHFFALIQIGKLYPRDHPRFCEAIDKAYDSLLRILEGESEIIIGIVDEEVVCGDNIFFSLSQNLQSSIVYLLDRNIERVIIRRALKKEELSNFIFLLANSKEDLRKDPQKFITLKGIKNIRTGTLKDYSKLEKEGEEDWEILRKIYRTSAASFSQFIGDVISGNDIEKLDLKFKILNIMEYFGGRHQELLNLVSIKNKDILTYVHLLNVSILAMQLSDKLGFSRDHIVDIGIAALFHDIGKISISSKIIKKPGKLSPAEFDKIKEHPILGMKILNKYVDNLGLLPAVVAFEHHLRFDLSGYPKLPYTKSPHLASFIVSLCDVYDALAQRRTYKKDFPPNKIYELMKQDKGKLFHPELFDHFFKTIGVWPIGSIVALSDGCIAVVRDVNEHKIFRPKVEVIEPEQKCGIIDLSEKKCRLEISKALNPFAEGKDYLSHTALEL
jgi:putative nucleotidyltransferase with HDIG domain